MIRSRRNQVATEATLPTPDPSTLLSITFLNGQQMGSSNCPGSGHAQGEQLFNETVTGRGHLVQLRWGNAYITWDDLETTFEDDPVTVSYVCPTTKSPHDTRMVRLQMLSSQHQTT